MTTGPSDKNAENPLPAWLQLLDHTADCGIRVTASDLAELFTRAAWGMFSIITDLNTVKGTDLETVTVTAPDPDALLVRWLSDLNFRHVTQHRLFSRFRILDLTDQRLVAEVAGEKFAPDRHTVYTEIKAVTYHGLRLRPTAEGWEAEIIFDV